MTLRLGINGFGRIGRAILRSVQARAEEDVQVVAINDPAPPQTLAHLFEFDSLHGRYPGTVRFENGVMRLDEQAIRMSGHSAPEDLPWGDVDIAYECTGLFTERTAAERHLENGSKRIR